MPPLFSCAGCGVQIERSTRSYVQRKGRVLCSTCLDRLGAASEEQPRPGGDPATAPRPRDADADPSGGPQP